MILTSISVRRRTLDKQGTAAHHVNPILDVSRDSWDDDFGSAMSWLWAVVEHLDYKLDENVPAEYGYRRGMGASEPEDTYEAEMLEDLRLQTWASSPQGEALWLAYLEHAGRVLNRIIDMARLNGTDY